LYSYDTLLEGLAQDFQDVAFELGPCIQKEHAVVRQRHLPGHRHLPAADQADIGDDVVGARHGRVVTRAVRAPVRSATRGRRVVLTASGSVITGRMRASRCARLDVPVPRRPAKRVRI
jgi:hypothetical protein